MTTSNTTFDVIVIGAGSGGLTAAVGFAKAGKRVLLVEREHLGGECTNSGCIPSKALLHHAKRYYEAISVTGQTADAEAYRTAAFSYVRSKINEVLATETPADFERLGITVCFGEASFKDRCQITVGTCVYRFKTAIIATGSSPRLIPIPGLDSADLLTNQNLFQLDTIPERTLILGSGPIGLEMGQALALLGSQVTIATIDDRLVKLEDPAIQPIIEAHFAELGITTQLEAHIQSVTEKVAHFTQSSGASATNTFTVPFDKILVAIGRTPNLLTGLAAAGIQADPQGIKIDTQYRTSNRHVYALGDVANHLKFTHTADDTARQVVTRVLSYGLLSVNSRKAVPKVTYTDPEMAQVGLSWSDAVRNYGADRVRRIEVPFTDNDRATTDSDTTGRLIVIARRLNGAILGAHIVGHQAGELITIFTLAIDRRISLWQLRRTIFAYPTYSLLIKKAADRFFATQLSELGADLTLALRRHAPKLIALLFWTILLYSFHQYRITQDLSYTELLLSLLSFFTSTVWGPLVYITLYALRPLILFPATLLTTLSGVLFGFWWGIVYTIIGENASANFAYVIGRFFGADLKLENGVFGNWVTALRTRPFGTVLFMRLFYVPFDLTNYGSGLLKINWWSYFTATVIGIMPGVTTFVALGAGLDIAAFASDGLSLAVFDIRFLALSVIIFITSLALSRVLKRWHSRAA